MRKKQKSSWGRFLVLWAVCLLLIGAIGCGIFYRYASIYERTDPSLVMDELMKQSMDEWKAELLATVPEDERGFEDLKSLFDPYFEATIRPATLRYRSDMARTDKNAAAFVVYTGRNNVCEVLLRPKAGTNAGFGRSEWELDRIECLDFRPYLTNVTLEIDAPVGAPLTLNGTRITDDYISQTGIDPPYLTELEKRFETPGSYARYRIEGLCGELNVADDDGHAFIAEETGDPALLRFTLDAAGQYSFRVEAPADATVSVNGAKLEAADVGTEYDMTKDLDAYTGGREYRICGYQAMGLYAEPEIRATGPDGAELNAIVGSNGTFYFLYPSEDNIPPEAQKAAEDYFDTYMAYSSASGSKAAALDRLMGMILRDTELYRYVRDSSDAMYWASETEIDFRELKFDHFRALSDDCVFCTVLFESDMTANTWYSKLNYDMRSGYQLLLVRKDGQWLVAAQSNLGD